MTLLEINSLAKEGKIDKVPREELTKKALLTKGPNAMPTISWIITKKQLKYIPKDLLTDEVLKERDLMGASGYLLASKTAQFDEIPKQLITPAILKETQNNEKVWGILIRSGGIKHILGFCKELIDDTELDHQSSLLHACATTCELNRIPLELITRNRLLKQKTKGKENVIHYAAHYGCLDQMPQHFLDESTMSITNDYMETPLHCATDGGKLNLIPQKFLTQQNLEKEDNWGTVFHKAAINCTFDSFPKEFLTEKNLILKGNDTEITPIYLLAQKCSDTNVYKTNKTKANNQFSKLIRLLSTKTLNDLVAQLQVDKYTEALNIAKNECKKRKIITTLTREKNNLEL